MFHWAFLGVIAQEVTARFDLRTEDEPNLKFSLPVKGHSPCSAYVLGL